MKLVQKIQKTINHIEKNLTERLSFDELAKISGFSRFHFQRVFKALTGESVGSYIRLRRLYESARIILTSKQRIIDVAITYGFESQEAYTRAFQRCFGETPGRLRRNKNHRLIIMKNPIVLNIKNLNGGAIMQPIFKKVPSFEVVGLRGIFNVKNKHEIPALWDRFIPMMSSLPYCSPCPAFGICECIQDDCCTQAQNCEEIDFNYTAGIEKSVFLEEIPEGLSVVTVPARSYAVFQTTLPKIGDSYSYIYGTWVQSSGYELDGQTDFEFYGRDFDHTNPESPLYIYIPIKEK